MEAHPDRNIPGLRPSPNTPSDVSCSSGPCSVVSTRETSPASSTHYPLETISAARDLFISCPGHHAAVTTELPPPAYDLSRPRSDISRPRPDMSRPRPGLHAEFPSPLEMNPNPFQSVNDRRSKLAVDNPRASHSPPEATPEGRTARHNLKSAPFGQPIAPIAPLHPSCVLPPPSTIPRGLSTTSWRPSTGSLESLITPPPTTSFTRTSAASPTRNTRPFPAASSSTLSCSKNSNIASRSNDGLLGHNSYVSVAGLSSSRPSPTYHHDNHQFEYPKSDRNTAKMHPQTGKIIADADMDHAMSYCYDRGGGQYTRLIPVDMLPVELQNIPRRVNTDEGMIVLPVPRQPGPDGQLANIQLETQRVVTPPSSPNGVATDNIQSRIDSIVNSSPGPGGNGALVLSGRGFDGSTPTRTIQHHGGGPGSGARREKIYCDKWIHDGTCAFTQQGCKYKHEMPHDRETQEKLGLFHGYPAWWKKQALDQQRPLAIDDRPVNVSAGRAGFATLGASASMGGGLVSSNWRSGPGLVGDGSTQGSPTSPSPTAGGSGGVLGRGGSIGFGGSGRGSARQVRTFGESMTSSPASHLPAIPNEALPCPVIKSQLPPLKPVADPSYPAASFQPATYGPIAPPSRAGGSSLSGSGSGTSVAPTTRSTRALTVSSAASGSNEEGGGAPYNHSQQRSASGFESGNPFAPLVGEMSQSSGRATRVRRDESSSNDTTADGDEEQQQRGAPL